MHIWHLRFSSDGRHLLSSTESARVLGVGLTALVDAAAFATTSTCMELGEGAEPKGS